MSDQVSRERDRAGRHAGAATRHDRAIEHDSGLVEQMPQFVGAPELFGLRIGDPVERQVAASWDVTATTPRPKLVGGALKVAGRARVDDLFATARDVGTDRLFVAHQLGAKARGELPRW